MKLTPAEYHEILNAVYEAHKANYERAIAENPAMEQWLAKPEQPTVAVVNPYWSMRGVLTASRRRWK